MLLYYHIKILNHTLLVFHFCYKIIIYEFIITDIRHHDPILLAPECTLMHGRAEKYC